MENSNVELWKLCRKLGRSSPTSLIEFNVFGESDKLLKYELYLVGYVRAYWSLTQEAVGLNNQ